VNLWERSRRATEIVPDSTGERFVDFHVPIYRVFPLRDEIVNREFDLPFVIVCLEQVGRRRC
jgi:hypothetical protein